MCGIVGIAGFSPVNQILYDSLLLLQHRGQDAAGIATAHSNSFSMSKGEGRAFTRSQSMAVPKQDVIKIPPENMCLIRPFLFAFFNNTSSFPHRRS